MIYEYLVIKNIYGNLNFVSYQITNIWQLWHLHLVGYLADKYEASGITSCENTHRPQYGSRLGNFEQERQERLNVKLSCLSEHVRR